MLLFKTCDPADKAAVVVNDAGAFEGYGAVFGNVDSHGEIVAKGAFKRSLAEHRRNGGLPEMLFNHDASRAVGTYTDMHEDDHGLVVKGQLWVDGDHPDPDALKVHRQMKSTNGRMGLSIGYMLKGSKMRPSGERELTEIDLREVSAVTFPSNGLARVTAVKADGEPPTIREFERALRESLGFSRDDAETIALHGFKTWAQRQQAAREALQAKLEAEAIGSDLTGRDGQAALGEIAALIRDQLLSTPA